MTSWQPPRLRRCSKRRYSFILMLEEYWAVSPLFLLGHSLGKTGIFLRPGCSQLRWGVLSMSLVHVITSNLVLPLASCVTYSKEVTNLSSILDERQGNRNFTSVTIWVKILLPMIQGHPSITIVGSRAVFKSQCSGTAGAKRYVSRTGCRGCVLQVCLSQTTTTVIGILQTMALASMHSICSNR